MASVLEDARATTPVPVVTFVVYDLPNRDCHARASNGEVCCVYVDDVAAAGARKCDYLAVTDCADGLREYMSEYIDPVAEICGRYASQVPIVLVIEPDSLPNLASNRNDPRCGNPATVNAYTKGVEYAVRTMRERAPGVTMYVDAAHGGWLGWRENLEQFVRILAQMDGVLARIRGFSTNVANYQSLGVQCPAVDWCLGPEARAEDPCCDDPCGALDLYNANGNNELNYVLFMHNLSATIAPGFEPRFVIDTSRNGGVETRRSCSHWCNIRGAGAGRWPTSDTGSALVDAFLWIKTPGESDGCSDASCARFDADCASEDSIGTAPGEPAAPEAGQWFEYQANMLAANARRERAAHRAARAHKWHSDER